jgi:DNA-binding NarL/FixJ family response regulator
MNQLRVLLADDHTLVRAGLRGLLESIPGVTVVAETGNGRQALALLLEHRPDVALVDITMPELNGLEVASRAAEEAPRTRVVILSMHASESYVAQALRARVSGYLVKDAAAEELPVLLRAVMRGETYLSPAISKQVVDGYLAKREDPAAPPQDPLATLTSRQREILQLLAEGRSTKEIATLLDVSAKTVETHRAQIMVRLGIRDVPGLVRFAIRVGLISAER